MADRLTSDGKYTITVLESSGRSGPYTLSLKNLVVQYTKGHSPRSATNLALEQIEQSLKYHHAIPGN